MPNTLKHIYIILCLFSINSYAQLSNEFGLSLGAANYLGEIGGKQNPARPFIYDLQVGKTKTLTGFYFRKKLSSRFSYRTAINYARISGADNLSTNEGRVGRNLSFTNNIFELENSLLITLYNANNFATAGRSRVDFNTYMFTGTSVFHHEPTTFYNGENVKLRTLKTEGVAYSPWQISIPMGIGMNYTFGRTLRIGVELSYRKTFTDYLDDISTVYLDSLSFGNPTAAAVANRRWELPSNELNSKIPKKENYLAGQVRGNASDKDNYMYLNVTVGYVIKGKNSFYKAKYRNITGVKRKWKKRRVRAKF